MVRWGKKPLPKVQFEWPSREILNQMAQDVTLKSITFKSHMNGCIASVQVTLSNGEESPVFETEGLAFNETIEFDDDVSITSVCAYEANDQAQGYINAIQFLDDQGMIAYDYVVSYKGTKKEKRIAANEQLIGVYGSIHEDDSGFSSFGFILKPK